MSDLPGRIMSEQETPRAPAPDQPGETIVPPVQLQPIVPVSSSSKAPTKRRTRPLADFILLALLIILFTQIGLYTVQPLGALPEGVTLLVWRRAGEQFFNSPDAMCLQIMGGVSLLCRAEALGLAPIDRIIVRLPYMEWAYLASTGGRSFER